MSFIRIREREGYDVVVFGAVAIPVSVLVGTGVLAFFALLVTCATGDIAFGWHGVGALIFISTLGVIFGVGALCGLILGLRYAWISIREVNR